MEICARYRPSGRGNLVGGDFYDVYSNGIGGWGLAINADIKDKQKQAAWAFIKWLDSPPVHKEFNLMGAGSFLRKSEMTDPDLIEDFYYAHGHVDFQEYYQS